LHVFNDYIGKDLRFPGFKSKLYLDKLFMELYSILNCL
jgi:hypothetical protein